MTCKLVSDTATNRFHNKFEWDAMRLIRLFIKVKAVDGRVTFLCVLLLFWHYFRVQCCEFRQCGDLIVCIELFIYLATVCFVYPDIRKGFVIQIRFVLQAR